MKNNKSLMIQFALLVAVGITVKLAAPRIEAAIKDHMETDS